MPHLDERKEEGGKKGVFKFRVCQAHKLNLKKKIF